MIKDPQKQVVVPHMSKEGLPYVGPRYSVTIADLADGYKHEYKTYWWVARRLDGSFICKAKSRDHANQIIQNCKCGSVWKALCSYEDEEVITARIETAREQHQNTHKPLDTQKRYKAEEAALEREYLNRRDAHIRQTNKSRLRNQIKKAIRFGESLGEITEEKQEILQEIQIDQTRKNLIKSLL